MLRRVVTLGSGRRSTARVLSRQQANGSKQLQAAGLRDPSTSAYTPLSMKYAQSGSIQRREYSSGIPNDTPKFCQIRSDYDSAVLFKLLPVSEDAEGPVEIIWKKKVGDEIAKGELIAQAKDSKNVLHPITSPHQGSLSLILAEHGVNDIDSCPPLAVIGLPGCNLTSQPFTLKKDYLDESFPEDWKTLEKVSHSLVQLPESAPAGAVLAFNVKVGAQVEKGTLLAVSNHCLIHSPTSGYVALCANHIDKSKPLSTGDPVVAIVPSKETLRVVNRARRHWRHEAEQKARKAQGQ